MSAFSRRALVVAALAAASACTVHDTTPPPLSGPSGLALSLNLAALPDTINQDGGSQSSIKVTAVGADGRGVSGLPLRMEMRVNGAAQDFAGGHPCADDITLMVVHRLEETGTLSVG